jgi:hypothetical protein
MLDSFALAVKLASKKNGHSGGRQGLSLAGFWPAVTVLATKIAAVLVPLA